ncbi:hypothetical protein SAMN05880570_4605 [Paenibacillus sp. RU4T]|nr:hypothetical protein SAMN05880555_4603 [Paenibacillus sp. RU4X]SIR73050.1 hypothetical protein SAMN05880570_4605 [Paenibacillus sp. RU4T]
MDDAGNGRENGLDDAGTEGRAGWMMPGTEGRKGWMMPGTEGSAKPGTEDKPDCGGYGKQKRPDCDNRQAMDTSQPPQLKGRLFFPLGRSFAGAAGFFPFRSLFIDHGWGSDEEEGKRVDLQVSLKAFLLSETSIHENDRGRPCSESAALSRAAGQAGRERRTVRRPPPKQGWRAMRTLPGSTCGLPCSRHATCRRCSG